LPINDIGVAINQFNARNSGLFLDGAYFRTAISAKGDPFLDSVKASRVKILHDEFDNAFNTGSSETRVYCSRVHFVQVVGRCSRMASNPGPALGQWIMIRVEYGH
jgi:hypothetical protein